VDKIKMEINKTFNNEIIVINNFLSKDEIQSIFNYIEKEKQMHKPEGISSEYFNNRLIQLPTEQNIETISEKEDTKDIAKIYLLNKNNIVNKINNILKAISEENLYLTGIENLIYSADKGMPIHFDDSPENLETNTHYGLVLYLNDDYDGGELYYPKLEIEYKPKCGDLVIHPGTEEYTHGVRDIYNGTRYAITIFAFTKNESSL